MLLLVQINSSILLSLFVLACPSSFDDKLAGTKLGQRQDEQTVSALYIDSF